MEKNLNKEQLQELVKQLQTEKEFTLEQLEKKIEDNFKLRQEILKLSKNG